MKRKLWPIVGIALIGIVGTVFILSKSPTPQGGDEHGGHEEHGAETPGDEHGGQHVEMSDDAIKTSGVEIKTAGIASLVVGAVYPGEVEPNPNRTAHIVPRLSGFVRQAQKNVGDVVRRGEIIAVMDATEMAQTKGDYLAALSRQELARMSMLREERLWKRRISPERNYFEAKQAYDEAQIEVRTAREQLLALGLSAQDLSHPSLTYLPIRSPIDGVILEKHVALGETIEEGASIFLLADLSTVWVDIAVPAQNLAQVRVGQNVTVMSDALGLTQEARVAFVGPALGEQTRTAQVFVELANPGRKWKPGLFVNVQLAQAEVEVPVAIRPSGLQTLENRTVVFVREGDAFEVRPVEVGRKSEEWVEIVSGLRAGEKYAAENSFIVKAEIGKGEAGHDH